MKDSTYALIDAATEHAAYYKADDRPGIKTDVMNAFYAGVSWATQHQSKRELPPLPPHCHSLNSGSFDPLYTADQMRAYVKSALAQATTLQDSEGT